MTTTAHSDIDRVRDATDLVRLIGEHVALRPRGREHVGICPFHDDRRPSLAVVTHKGNAFYKCFACGAAGDCFRFVMEFHKMEFPEALRFLAERAGIVLSERRTEPRGSGDAPRRADLLKANAFAAEFFQRVLADPVAGARARSAVEDRGIAPAMVERFMLGAAPDGQDALGERIRQKPSAVRTAIAAGLLRERGVGEGHYDTFRHRLIFPICDEVGRVVAFGARIIRADDQPKYLNSAESALFHKSRTLYGLHLARRAIVRERRAVVVEGYTDVIACHQASIENVVGTLGTALTREHAAALERLCDTVVLVFDGDEAGRRAADRAVEIFFAASVDVRICVLPEGLDPDELLRREDGTATFRTAVDAAIDALEYKLRRFRDGLGDTDGLSAKQKHLERFVSELADLGFGAMPGVRKRLVLSHLADLMKLPLLELERVMAARVRARRPRGEVVPAVADAGTDAEPAPESLLAETAAITRARRIAERELLSILLFEPAAVAAALRERGDDVLRAETFAHPASRRIAEVVLGRVATGAGCTMQEVLADLRVDEDRKTAGLLYFEGQRRCGDAPERAAEEAEEAATTLGGCLETERSERSLAALRAAAGGAEAGDRVLAALDQIRRQHEARLRPAAISQGERA